MEFRVFVVRSTGAFSKLGSFARSPKIAIHISLKGSFYRTTQGNSGCWAKGLPEWAKRRVEREVLTHIDNYNL